MTETKIDDEELKNILNRALGQFYDRENFLINRKGMEQACVFRIGLYISELLKEIDNLKSLNLDCEYNKHGDSIKIMLDFENGARPDLIIHERGIDEKNLFVVEFKGCWNENTNRDIKKLERFTNANGDYHYQLGALVILEESLKECKLRYFKNGKEIT